MYKLKHIQVLFCCVNNVTPNTDAKHWIWIKSHVDKVIAIERIMNNSQKVFDPMWMWHDTQWLYRKLKSHSNWYQ